MKRKFADITILPSDPNIEELKKIIYKASILGYKLISFNIHVTKIDKLPDIKSLAEKLGLDIVTRIDVTFEKQWLIKKCLRKYRRKVELISLRGINRSITAFGCRDRRIDIISVDPNYKLTLFKGDILNMLEQDKALELTARPLIFANKLKERIRTLQLYEKLLKLSIHKGIKIIFGSGATKDYEMRDARSLASIVIAFFNIDYETSLDMLSRNIFNIVERNRFKLSPFFVWPGIYISSNSENYD